MKFSIFKKFQENKEKLKNQQEFIENMKILEKKAEELLLQHKIVEQGEAGGNYKKFTDTFQTVWESYYHQGNSMMEALMLAVVSYTEGKASSEELTVVCQSISSIVCRLMPNSELAKEVAAERASKPVTIEQAEHLAKDFKNHFGMQ